LGRIRIRLLAMPRLVRELIELAVRAEPDMEVVEDGAILASADFVVCGAPTADAASEGRSFLAEQARVRVVELDAAAGRASLFELQEHEEPIGDVSPAELVDAIRAAAARRRA